MAPGEPWPFRGRPFITTAASTARATPSPCTRVGRSRNTAMDRKMGTSTPSRANTEERMAPFLWMLYPWAAKAPR